MRKDGEYAAHWLIEYYDNKQQEWIICDSEPNSGKNYTNMSHDNLCWIAKIWLNVRNGKDDVNKYIHGSTFQGLNMLAYSLFFDCQALMGNEISYLFMTNYIDDDSKFFSLMPEDLKELGALATLMLVPDKNFDTLRYLFLITKSLEYYIHLCYLIRKI